ncbi:hypothetical protein BCR34DRAFT_590799 [Clohesyomyces aquaticus]|uniref:Uncharacterized protein n=1 Tax=Clohesyomyces aquaticus TaxID=1231657 RepID=A0A1Y1Z6I3_9PLEO|nr:hypothetical protein BCR34DRAFT_590799 [Clohesyomyces aquaticus]
MGCQEIARKRRENTTDLTENKRASPTLAERAEEEGEVLPSRLLLLAVRREAPNMAVVHLLVEKLGSSFNHEDIERSVPVDSLLLSVVAGYHWGQAALALPYLIERRADLKISGSIGRTPLHITFGGLYDTINALFRREAAHALVAAGADVNLVTSAGTSCLYLACQDVEIVQLLVDNGAAVYRKTLLATMDDGQIHPRRPEEDERDNEAAPARRVEAFLAHGADPFATYRQRREKGSMFESFGRFESISDGPEIDELATASPDPIPSGEDETAAEQSASTSLLFNYPLEPGYPCARDNLGRNALHQMMQPRERFHNGPQQFRTSFKRLASTHPKLVNQKDLSGRIAAERPVDRTSPDTSGAELLLAAGNSDPSLADSDGNTAPHVLAKRLDKPETRALF